MILSAALGGCLTTSPLLPDERVDLEGRLLQVDGTAAADLPVQLRAHGQNLTARSNAAGNYRFELKGSETQVLGVAVELMLSAGRAPAPRLRQGVKALKTETSLPAMRFWDGLSAPAADTELSGDRNIFSWQPPPAPVRHYQFNLLDSEGDSVWHSQTLLPNFELPLAVMDPQRNYSWEVVAVFSDYEATSGRRPLRSGEPKLRPLPVRAIRSSEPAREYPSFHDGRYQFLIGDRLDYSSKSSIELEIELTRPGLVRGLHWAGSGFEAEVEIRAQRNAEPIARHSLQSQAIFEWAPVNTDRLWLRLKTPKDGFSDVTEIRVLG
ncbi:MAG: hypothetical protein CVV27_16665 [Candidatus Melainabacteria bacterium HGW-Melainabacteria-1]|nr:MAG: hypothetical protein CVV27_16665 [Candidatus Melainabacteria bacterium HGW-Melainabacteria-1]